MIPCYNEASIINNTIDGILRVNYEKYECIFINDGSLDNTMRKLKKRLKLKRINYNKKDLLNTKKVKNIYQSKRHPRIFVIDKVNGGKSDALNAGINFSTNNYVITLDADSILDKNALALVSGAFKDSNVVAVSGVIQILQSFNLYKDGGKTTLKLSNLLKLQTLEYMKSCFCYKASLAKNNALIVISGAFGAFRKDLLLSINGFKRVVGEDLDLTIRIQIKIKDTNKKIIYLPNAICYTEGPGTFKDYIRQRIRWQKSFIECLVNYKAIIFKYIFTQPLSFFMIIDSLFIGIISSFIILIFSIIIIKSILLNNLNYILIYILIFLSTHLIYNIGGIIIASFYNIKYVGINFLRLLFTIILDITIYRVIILTTIIMGTISYFINKNSWNKVKRSGYNYNILKKSDNYG
ncbi:MAG: glycosyltransferase [Bacilli bacterium]|nr:glycosyltransferase [Bacilli bacterium]